MAIKKPALGWIFLLLRNILLESKDTFFKAITGQGGSTNQSYFQAEY
jgi:hypothetical protein